MYNQYALYINYTLYIMYIMYIYIYTLLNVDANVMVLIDNCMSRCHLSQR